MLDVWGHMGPGGGGPGALPPAMPCSVLSSVEQHQKLDKMQNKGAAVQIPRSGDQGLMLGRTQAQGCL